MVDWLYTKFKSLITSGCLAISGLCQDLLLCSFHRFAHWFVCLIAWHCIWLIHNQLANVSHLLIKIHYCAIVDVRWFGSLMYLTFIFMSWWDDYINLSEPFNLSIFIMVSFTPFAYLGGSYPIIILASSFGQWHRYLHSLSLTSFYVSLTFKSHNSPVFIRHFFISFIFHLLHNCLDKDCYLSGFRSDTFKN